MMMVAKGGYRLFVHSKKKKKKGRQFGKIYHVAAGQTAY